VPREHPAPRCGARGLRGGRAAGVKGTPTFIVNGRQIVGAQRFRVFQKAVQDALADGAGKQP
jgi:protein-disulfide isomerase